MTQVLGSDDRYFSETDDLTTTYTYTDAADNTILGLVKTVTDPNGNLTYIGYNSQGLVEGVIYAAETETIEQYEYDNRDRLSVFMDARGNVTAYKYNNLDQLIQRIDPDPDGYGGDPSPVWQYTYDPNGNQTHVIDPLGYDTEYVYDERSGEVASRAQCVFAIAHRFLETR